MKKLPPQTVTSILSLYSSGISPKEIAEQFNIYPNSVSRIIRKSGIERNQLSKITPDNKEVIVSLFKSGLSAVAIGKKFNVTGSSISRFLKKSGYRLKGKKSSLKPIKAMKEIMPKVKIEKVTSIPVLDVELPENYGTSLIYSFDGIQLTAKNILQMDLEQKNAMADKVFEYLRKYGFPMPSSSEDELREDYDSLVRFNTTNVISEEGIIKSESYKNGIKVFKHFSPHFFTVSVGGKPTYLDVFYNDELLKKVITNRMGISYKETFNITGNMIRQGLRNSFIAGSASIFKPAVAKTIFDRYAPRNGFVYDYSAGFGQRMLGAMASPKNLKYIGTDPWAETNVAISKTIKFFGFEKRARVYQMGSEKFCPPDFVDKIDLAFSSPPYYDLETYTDEKSQAYANGYEGYLNWWRATSENIHKLLKVDGLLIINIDDKNRLNMIDKIGDMFEVKETLYLQSWPKHKRDTPKREPIVVLRRI